MPAKPQWMLRLDDVVWQLRLLETSVVDRAVVEKVFGVRRRQAIQLLHRFGGYRSAQSFLVERQELIRRLETLLAGKELTAERQRRQRLEEHLQEARRQHAAASVRIPVRADRAAREVSRLPEGIRLRAGRLEVDFSGAEQLLGRLFELAQTAANDFDAFRACVEPQPPFPLP